MTTPPTSSRKQQGFMGPIRRSGFYEDVYGVDAQDDAVDRGYYACESESESEDDDEPRRINKLKDGFSPPQLDFKANMAGVTKRKAEDDYYGVMVKYHKVKHGLFSSEPEDMSREAESNISGPKQPPAYRIMPSRNEKHSVSLDAEALGNPKLIFKPTPRRPGIIGRRLAQEEMARKNAKTPDADGFVTISENPEEPAPKEDEVPAKIPIATSEGITNGKEALTATTKALGRASLKTPTSKSLKKATRSSSRIKAVRETDESATLSSPRCKREGAESKKKTTPIVSSKYAGLSGLRASARKQSEAVTPMPVRRSGRQRAKSLVDGSYGPAGTNWKGEQMELEPGSAYVIARESDMTAKEKAARTSFP